MADLNNLLIKKQGEIDRLRARLAERDKVIVAMRDRAGHHIEAAIRAHEAGQKNLCADHLASASLALTPSDLSDYVLVPVGHLQEAMRFYPPHDHDTKTQMIGEALRAMTAAYGPGSE